MEKKPTIRFEGYTEDWEQRKVGEFYDFKNGLNKGKEFFGEGTPIVNFTDVFHNRGIYAKSLKGKVTLEPNEIKNYEVKKGDIFFTRTSETIEEIGYPSVMLDAVENTVFSGFVLRGRCCQSEDPLDDLLKKYVFFTDAFREEMLKKSSMTTRALTSGTAIKNMIFRFPKSKEEQHKIAEYLTTLDHLINLHQSNYEKMVATKKSMRDKLFPQGDAKVPAIRFEGFEGDWKKKPLGTIVVPYTDPVKVPHNGYERLGIRSHGKGVFYEHVEAGKEITTAQLHRVAAHNFIVNITFAWEHAVAVTCDSDAGKLVSHRFPQFSMADGTHDQFLKYLILDARFRHHLLLSSPGGAGRNRVLKIPEMLEYEMMIPDIEEQKQIAGYLNSLDDLIELYRIRGEKLKNIKVACLQGMFV